MRRSTLTFVPALILALCLSTSSPAADVVDNAVGYLLRVPEGWRQIPAEAMQQSQAVLTKPGASAPKFIAAYEPESHTSHFQYPYVMVQVHDYGNGLSLSAISRSEVEQLVKSLTGTGAQRLKENLADDVAKLMTDPSIESPAVTTTPPGFVMGMRMSVAGSPIRGRTLALFGRTNVVFLHFYAKESELATQAPAMEEFAAGFRRTPAQTVTLGSRTLTTGGRPVGGGGFDWSKVGSRALIGAAIGAMVGAFGWLSKRKKKTQ
jgi:hypothetical protein